MEPALSAADAAGHAAGVYAVFRGDHGALHHLFVLRKPDLRVFQRVNRTGHDILTGKRRYFLQGQCAEVSVFAVEKHSGHDKLRPNAAGVFPVLHSGRHHMHLEVRPAAVPHLLPGPVQYWCRTDSFGPVHVLP